MSNIDNIINRILKKYENKPIYNQMVKFELNGESYTCIIQTYDYKSFDEMKAHLKSGWGDNVELITMGDLFNYLWKYTNKKYIGIKFRNNDFHYIKYDGEWTIWEDSNYIGMANQIEYIEYMQRKKVGKTSVFDVFATDSEEEIKKFEKSLENLFKFN